MRNILPGLLVGLIFGAGLALSDMVNPARVMAFLDLAGAWDPTLAFVMAGAILPMALAWLLRKRLERPLADTHFHLPGTDRLDARLAIGAILFGIGWGIGGLCPGPAIAGLALVPQGAAFFLVSMLAGMLLERALPPRSTGRG